MLTRCHVGNPSLKWLPLSKDIFGLNKVFVLTAGQHLQVKPNYTPLLPPSLLYDMYDIYDIYDIYIYIYIYITNIIYDIYYIYDIHIYI